MSEPQSSAGAPESADHHLQAQGAPRFPASPVLPRPFVGRVEQLARSLAHLERDGVVGITGPAGVGKSALAAAIAWECGRPVVWVTLSEGGSDQIAELLWQLARPLIPSERDLQGELDQLRRDGYPPLVCLHAILAAYARQSDSALICIDQFEQALGAALRSLLIELCEYVALNADTHISLVIVGRALPIRLRPYMLPPLSGLSPVAISDWATALGLTLSSEQIAQIALQTGGLPTALHALRIALSEGGAGPTLGQLMALRELRQLVVSILGELPVEAQRTAADLATHPERYASLSAEALSILELLEAQHLVTIAPAAVRLHPFLQAYYQQLLG